MKKQNEESIAQAGGAPVYLLLGLGWAAAYALTARLSPGAFSGLPADVPRLQGFDALYFSLTTITTAGFGDLAPAARPAADAGHDGGRHGQPVSRRGDLAPRFAVFGQRSRQGRRGVMGQRTEDGGQRTVKSDP